MDDIGSFDIEGASKIAFEVEQAQQSINFGIEGAQELYDQKIMELSQIVSPDVADDPMARAAMIQKDVGALKGVIAEIDMAAEAASQQQAMAEPEITGKPLEQETSLKQNPLQAATGLWDDDMPATAPAQAASVARVPLAPAVEQKATAMNMLASDNAATAQEYLDDKSIQQHSHTNVDTSEQELATLKMNIENDIKTAMAGGTLSEKEAVEIARAAAVGTGVDAGYVESIGERAYKDNMGLDEYMNGTANGEIVQQEQAKENSGILGSAIGAFAGFGAAMAAFGTQAKEGVESVISTLFKSSQETGVDFEIANASRADLGSFAPNIAFGQSREIGGPGVGV